MPNLIRRRRGGFDESYLEKVLSIEPANLIGCWLQNELSGAVSIDSSGKGHHGAYTGATLGQPGVPGMGMTSPLYDGVADYNNISSVGFNNDNLLSNPGFETAGGAPPVWANWGETVGDGALANEVVIVHEGVDACKMTAGVLVNTEVHQAITTTAGEEYRLRFWTQGDGANAGRYGVISGGVWVSPIVTTGVAGAAYAIVSTTFVAEGATASLYLFCPPVNGSACYYDATEVRSMDGFLGDVGSIIAPWQVANAGVWTNGVHGYVMRMAVDAQNFIQIRKNNAPNNSVSFLYMGGNVQEFRSIAGQTSIDFIFFGMTWDRLAGADGEVLYFLNGIQNGAADVALGTWVGDLSNTEVVLGASNITPNNVWLGNGGSTSMWNTALTPAQMLEGSTV